MIHRLPFVLAVVGALATSAHAQTPEANEKVASTLLGRARAAAATGQCPDAIALRNEAVKYGAKWKPLQGCTEPAEAEAASKLRELGSAAIDGNCQRVEQLASEINQVHPGYFEAFVRNDPARLGCQAHAEAKEAAAAKDCARASAAKARARRDNPGYYDLHVRRDPALAVCADDVDTQPTVTGSSSSGGALTGGTPSEGPSEPGSSPNWGLSLGLVSNSAVFGFTKFVSPNAALTLNLGIDYENVTVGMTDLSEWMFTPALAVRFYVGGLGRARAFVQPGVTLGFGIPYGEGMMMSDASSVSIGVALGAEFLITPNLSIAGTTGAALTFLSIDDDAQDASAMSFKTGTSSLFANIYW